MKNGKIPIFSQRSSHKNWKVSLSNNKPIDLIKKCYAIKVYTNFLKIYLCSCVFISAPAIIESSIEL